jgi:hypothetical protein
MWNGSALQFEQGAYYSVALLAAIALAQLYLAHLHWLTLYNHLRDGDISPYSSQDISADSMEASTSGDSGPTWQQRFKHRLALLTTRKSLFCLSSLAWLLLTLLNRICIGLIMLLDGPVGPLFAYPTSIFELVLCVGFVFFAWSYLVIGCIWLDLVSFYICICLYMHMSLCVQRLCRL